MPLPGWKRQAISWASRFGDRMECQCRFHKQIQNSLKTHYQTASAAFTTSTCSAVYLITQNVDFGCNYECNYGAVKTRLYSSTALAVYIGGAVTRPARR